MFKMQTHCIHLHFLLLVAQLKAAKALQRYVQDPKPYDDSNELLGRHVAEIIQTSCINEVVHTWFRGSSTPARVYHVFSSCYLLSYSATWSLDCDVIVHTTPSTSVRNRNCPLQATGILKD
jgi:hypothetical protein